MVGDAARRAKRRDRVFGRGAMGMVERDYMWNTLGIRDWIVRGGHLVDDWIESSCLSGMSLVFGGGRGIDTN